MNIANAGYSEAQIIREISKSNRRIWYEYTVQNSHGRTLAQISVSNASISYDSNATIMRTLKGTVARSELINLNTIDSRIVPWFCLEVGEDVIKWPLGHFLINPSEICKGLTRYIDFTGYDLGRIAYDDKITSRLYVPRGSVYTSQAAQVIGSDYSNIDVVASLLTKNADQEWGIGTRRIDIANELLQAINYNPVHFDENGKGIIDAYTLPQLRPVEYQYMTDNSSLILDSITKTSSKFDVPNRFVRYVENADADYYISVYENNMEDSPYSIQNRGRVIVDVDSVKDIATQSELDAYTIKCASEAMQVTDQVKFRTLTMPFHGFRNCLYLEIPEYGIEDKYIEVAWEMELRAGGTMSHTCERVVVV